MIELVDTEPIRLGAGERAQSLRFAVPIQRMANESARNRARMAGEGSFAAQRFERGLATEDRLGLNAALDAEISAHAAVRAADLEFLAGEQRERLAYRHWLPIAVQLERRSESAIRRARKLADEY